MMQLCVERFDDLVGANGLNLVMKPWEGGGQELDVLGMHVDLARGIVSPTKGKQQAMAQRAHRLIQGGPTNLDLLRWSGLISWMCYSTARYPLWFSQRIRCKTLRRICCDQDKFDELATQPATVKDEVEFISRTVPFI